MTKEKKTSFQKSDARWYLLVLLLVGVWCIGCQSSYHQNTISSAPSFEDTVQLDSSIHHKYDQELYAGIARRWYDLLAANNFPSTHPGKVVVQFRLHSNGNVTDINVVETTVSASLSLICEKAIGDSAPYPKWPEDLRAMAGNDLRNIKFTFNYRDPDTPTTTINNNGLPLRSFDKNSGLPHRTK